MEPFTTLHIWIQSGTFDQATRLFSSVADAWRSVTPQPNDFHKLVPEFFFQPEFLVNANGFDLGDADGVRLNDVALPPWADTALDFVYKQRKALESSIVTEGLPAWIDLIWGCGQRDPSNRYDPMLSDTVWRGPDADAHLVEAALEACGHVPPAVRPTAPQAGPPRARPPGPADVAAQVPCQAVLFSRVCQAGAKAGGPRVR
jgi:hypothetical protein